MSDFGTAFLVAAGAVLGGSAAAVIVVVIFRLVAKLTGSG